MLYLMSNSELNDWIYSLDENILNFINKLKKNKFEYFPTKEGLTKEGKEINLGFACFALKIKYILNDDEVNDNRYLDAASSYLNKFQGVNPGFPDNSFFDQSFLDFHLNPNIKNKIKDNLKEIANNVGSRKYLDKNIVLQNYIRAETKQAISTLYQIGRKNKLKYLDFPVNDDEIEKFMLNQDWRFPWNAGAQFSTLCLFSKTQLDDKSVKETKINLDNYIKSISNYETGGYFLHKTPNTNELINGSMKVISGLDWLGSEIHYPERLIDFCLQSNTQLEGCDIVDIVYVLYKCTKQTNYRREEIAIYLDNLIADIKLNFNEKDKAFSYYFQSSQKYYYGLTISKGKNHADIHGSLLLIWALSMIFEITDKYKKNWNVLKP